MEYALSGSEINPIIIGYPNGTNAIRPYKNGMSTISTHLRRGWDGLKNSANRNIIYAYLSNLHTKYTEL